MAVSWQILGGGIIWFVLAVQFHQQSLAEQEKLDMVQLAKSKTLRDAWKIDADLLYEELEKLPDKKIHCARLAIKTLQKALEEYEKNRSRKRVDQQP